MGNFKVRLIKDGKETSEFNVRLSSKYQADSELETFFYHHLRHIFTSWSVDNPVPASINNVIGIIIRPQDSHDLVALSGPNLVSELANEVATYLAGDVDIQIDVIFEVDATSVEDHHAEQYVCVQDGYPHR
jgi:hypothetical protein